MKQEVQSGGCWRGGICPAHAVEPGLWRGEAARCNGLRMWAHRSDLPVLEILALLLPKPSFRGGRRRRVRIRFPYTELSGAKGV